MFKWISMGFDWSIEIYFLSVCRYILVLLESCMTFPIHESESIISLSYAMVTN